jgi:hypothetical protein
MKDCQLTLESTKSPLLPIVTYYVFKKNHPLFAGFFVITYRCYLHRFFRRTGTQHACHFLLFFIISSVISSAYGFYRTRFGSRVISLPREIWPHFSYPYTDYAAFLIPQQ